MEPIQVIEFSKSEKLFRLLQRIYAPSASASRVAALGILRRIFDLEDIESRTVITAIDHDAGTITIGPGKATKFEPGDSVSITAEDPEYIIDGETVRASEMDLFAPDGYFWAVARASGNRPKFELFLHGVGARANIHTCTVAWSYGAWRYCVNGSDGEASTYRIAMTSATVLVCHGSAKSAESTPIEPDSDIRIARHQIGATDWFLCVEGRGFYPDIFKVHGKPFIVQQGDGRWRSSPVVNAGLIVGVMPGHEPPQDVRDAIRGLPLPTWGRATKEWSFDGFMYGSPTPASSADSAAKTPAD